ncbi:MAG: hypothetical protein R3C14_46330 [Caldilineaceae bacterium]
MITRFYRWQQHRLVVTTLLVAVVVLGGLGLLNLRTAEASAPMQAFPANCAGTYLIQEGSGAQSLWSLEKDGVMLGTSSAQAAFNFTNQQGTWEKNGAQGVKAVLLDFSFDANSALLNTGRVDIQLHTADNGCTNVAGQFTLRFYEAGEDPLNPGSDTGQPISDTFTGRRVKISN